MGTYRTISSEFWNDPKIEDDFTPEDKYFFLYLLTNRHTNLCGCYEVSKRQMSKETGYNVEVIENLLYRFKNIHGVIDYDEKTKELLLINWHKYNWSDSEKLVRGVEKAVDYIENESFRSYVMDVLEAHRSGSKAYPIYRVSYPIHTVSYPMDTSVTVTDTVSNNNTVKDMENTKTVNEYFEEWWKAYPARRKGSKQECRKKYASAIKSNKDLTPEKMLTALEAQKRSKDWMKQNGEYVPSPLTWLNQGRWEDEIYEGGLDGNTQYVITEQDRLDSL